MAQSLIQNIEKTSRLEPPKHIKYKRVQTPTLIQMEAVECGAAALGIILHHYGLFIPLEELRSTCGISRDGSKASYVVNAARSYGLEAKGFKKEPTDLYELKPPFIIFWNFNHFLVVEGFGKNCVYLNNPASGPQTVTYDEFDASFTGVVLYMEPGPNFKKGGTKPNIFNSLKKRMTGAWGGLIYSILAGLILVVPGLIVPIFSKLFVDNVLIKGMQNFLMPLLFGMAFAAIIKGALTYAQAYYLMRLENKLSISMSAKFFWHVLRLPYDFFTQRSAGDISSRIQINDQIASILSGSFASTTISMVMVIFYALLMFTYDVTLTLIGIAMALINFVGLRFVLRRQADANARLGNESRKLLSTSVNGLHMIETLKASGTESDFFSKWSGVQAKVVNAQQELNISSQVISSIPNMLNALTTAIILVVGGLRVMDGQITLGTLVAFQGLMASFLGPIGSFIGLGAVLQQADEGLKRLDDVLDYKMPPEKEADLQELPLDAQKLTGTIEFKNVTFGYNKFEPPLIENFNLTVKPGQRIALVGGSGSGKSTLSNTMAGLYEPWSGEILFDGKPRSEISNGILTSSIAMVNQEIALFDGTIQENISMWDNTMPKSVIVQAAQDACIHEDIEARPGGYDAIVEEGGRNFSGGQKQRIEIARAFSIEPSILIMDESTSALDPNTEFIIDNAVRRRGCTCIIVAHRLSTIRDADEIIVLSYGKVVERGTHESMKDAGGPYSELIKS